MPGFQFNREQTTLSNGLRVICDRRESSIAVSISCIIKVGSRNDYPGKEGIAHCLEHLLFRSRLAKSSESLFKDFSDAGGEMNGVTMVDRTGFVLRCLSEDVDLGIRILASLIVDLPSSPEELKAEQAIISEEVLFTGEDSAQAFQRVKYKLLGGDETLQHVPMGRMKLVNRITPEDLQTFHREFYSSDNMVISVVGNIDPDDVRTQLEERFAGLPSHDREAKPLMLSTKGPKLHLWNGPPVMDQSHIACFFRCPSLQSEGLATLELINDHLAGGTHSRLFQRLREEESLVYSVEGELCLMSEFGTLDILAPTQKRNVYKVLTILLDEIEKLKRDSFTDDTLHAMQQSLVKRGLLAFDDVSMASWWYAEMELLSSRENADDFMTWVTEVEQTTGEDLNAMIHEVFTPENSFVYVIGYLWPWRKMAVRKRLKAL